MDLEEVKRIVGAILFTSDRPVSKERILYALGEKFSICLSFEQVISTLKADFNYCGLELREANNGYQLVTHAESSPYIRRFLEAKPFRLGKATLEVLSIIAYRQPITRFEIDSVRGIESSHLIRTLIERGLVGMQGKAELPGRPVQYGTTEKFLELIGVRNLSELPPLSELEELQGHAPDNLEEGLTQFLDDTSAREEIHLEDSEEVESIEQMLKSAEIEDSEVYPSKEHADAAAENRLALKSFQTWNRSWFKKPVPVDALPLQPSDDAAVVTVPNVDAIVQ